ncbi:hypothetical protein [Alteraurantiacibacter palmitatis]|uniref:Uncharacterized protein n=1 Tax=Alteraurantiacibacter palmitatis TaxID=2054628 RepID=A0ABV7EA72_9SPHN
MEWLSDPRLSALIPILQVHGWGMLAGLGIVLGVAGWRNLRRAWFDWLWSRRLQRLPLPSEEERRDHMWRRGKFDPAADDPAPNLWAKLQGWLSHALLVIASYLSAAVLVSLTSLSFGMALGIVLGLYLAAVWLWPRINPEPDRDTPFSGLDTRESPALVLPMEGLAMAAAIAVVIGALAVFNWALW